MSVKQAQPRLKNRSNDWGPPSGPKVGQDRPYVHRKWTDDERHLAVAYAVHGFTLAEIARVLNRSEGALSVYFSTQLGLKPTKLAQVWEAK